MQKKYSLLLAGLSIVLSLVPGSALGQAPPTIQFFMPDGSVPTRQLRFQMESHDGRVVDTFFTDVRGKFLITRSQGLTPNVGYRVTIESDGRTFNTTTVSFYHYRDTVYYVPVFLKPLEANVAKSGAVDLAELDSAAPKDAREAYHRGLKAYSDGRVDESISELQKALSIYPEYFRALNDLGVILMKLNRLDEAAKVLERANKLAPRVYYPRLNLGVIKTRQKKFKEAIALLEQLHKDNPSLVEVRVRLADAMIADGRLRDADGHLRAALADDRLDRDNAGDAHYLLGLLLNREEKFEEAVSQLTVAAK